MLALLVLGCGTVPAPNAEFADTQGAISAAEATGAQNTPQASLYLKMSKDGLKLAQEQMAKEQNDEARRTLERARADALLATSLTANAHLQQEAALALKQIEDLENESPQQ
jgi:hypothetical protein